MKTYSEILFQVIDKETFLKYLDCMGHLELRDLILFRLVDPLDEAVINKAVSKLGIRPPSEYERKALAEIRDKTFVNEAQENILAQLRGQELRHIDIEERRPKDVFVGNHSRGIRVELSTEYLQNIAQVEDFIEGGTDLVLMNYGEYTTWLESGKKGSDPRNKLYNKLADYIDEFGELFKEAEVDFENIRGEIITEAVESIQFEFTERMAAERSQVANSNEFIGFPKK
jgi:hypothetical protein